MARVRGYVRGDKALQVNMRRAYNSVGGQFLDRMLVDALEPMRDQTEENARKLRNYNGKYPGFPQPATPRKGGHLDQGIVIRKREQRGRLHRVYWISFSKRARKKAHLVEFGTAPHFQPNFRGGFNHPGAAPRPFMRPAFETKKKEVLSFVARRTWRQISTSILAQASRRP